MAHLDLLFEGHLPHRLAIAGEQEDGIVAEALVRVGDELANPALSDLALVGAAYGIANRTLGAVSLIGPSRMDYDKAIRTVRSEASARRTSSSHSSSSGGPASRPKWSQYPNTMARYSSFSDTGFLRCTLDFSSRTRPVTSDPAPTVRRLLQLVGTEWGRALDPDNNELFTWWAPWRNLRQRNIGWRLDYVLASRPLASRAQ